MKKKILSLALCVAMLLSLGSLMISAEKVDGTKGKVMYANYGTIDVDGTIDNAMQMDTQPTTGAKGLFFGATWDADYLYFGVAGIETTERSAWGATNLAGVKAALTPIKSFAAVLENGGYSITAATGAVTGLNTVAAVSAPQTLSSATNSNVSGHYFAEIAIPMDQVVLYDLGNGYIGTNVKLSVNSDAGSWINFLGVVALSDTAQVEGYDVSGEKNYDIVNGHDRVGADFRTSASGTRYASGQVLARAMSAGIKAGISNHSNLDATTGWPKIVDPAFNGSNGNAMDPVEPLYNNAYTAYLPTDALEVGKHIVAQEDILLTNLPVADLSTIQAEESTGAWASAYMKSNEVNPGRALLVVGMGSGNYAAASNGYVIYNTSGGLVLYDDIATNSVALGVSQGSYFNLRLELDANRNTDVYVNSRYVGTIAYSGNAKAFQQGILFDGGFQTSVTVGNTVKASGSVGVTVRNAFVAQESDAAVAALATLKAKIGEVSYQARINANNTYDVRFMVELSTTKEADLANYKEIGFDLIITNPEGETATTSVVVSKVFDTVMADGQLVNPDGYLAAAVVKGISTAENYSYVVKPYVIFKVGVAGEGEKVYFDTADLTLTYDAAANDMVKA